MGRGGLRCVLALLCLVVPTAAAEDGGWEQIHVRTIQIQYRTHDGLRRAAYVLVPDWYGPARHPPLPLVISPHGRGVAADDNADRWGDLPAVGSFAVVNPEGQGRRFAHFSWGYPGQIDDLARMPQIVRRALPWLRIDSSRIYAFGASMGGQESLLLLGRRPSLLAGVAAFDPVTDMAKRYRDFRRLPCNRRCVQQWGATLREGPAHEGARRDRRHAAQRTTRVRTPQPDGVRAPDREVRRAGAAVVEPLRPCRRPARPVGPVRADAASPPSSCSVPHRRRPLAAFRGDASVFDARSCTEGVQSLSDPGHDRRARRAGAPTASLA